MSGGASVDVRGTRRKGRCGRSMVRTDCRPLGSSRRVAGKTGRVRRVCLAFLVVEIHSVDLREYHGCDCQSGQRLEVMTLRGISLVGVGVTALALAFIAANAEDGPIFWNLLKEHDGPAAWVTGVILLIGAVAGARRGGLGRAVCSGHRSKSVPRCRRPLGTARRGFGIRLSQPSAVDGRVCGSFPGEGLRCRTTARAVPTGTLGLPDPTQLSEPFSDGES